jgi:hypothetical protein
MDIDTNVTEGELRKLDLATLATQSREAWDSVKDEIPEEIQARIGPHFNVLTDPGFLREKAPEMVSQGR